MMPRRSHQPWRQRGGIACLLLALVPAIQGCGDAALRADSYRLQQGLWEAYRAEQAATLLESTPDSTTRLALRLKYIGAVDAASASLRSTATGRPRSAIERRFLQVISQGEIEAARLAHAAGRPDLALARCRGLVQLAEGDTSVTRRADILIAGSLRRMGRFEEAIDAMKGMMVRYPPRPPDSTGIEDFVLSLPIMIVDLRKELGDERGTGLALKAAETYYQGLAGGGGLAPTLEAQVRSRWVHTLLEQEKMPEAMAGLDSLESLVTRVAEMSPMIPEVRYTRIKLRSMSERDHSGSIEALERLAFVFPASPVAPRALFDAAVLSERSNHAEEARQTYEQVAVRYPQASELASMAILRQAMLEDRAGRWDKSKSLLESIPARFPRTPAAAQAPISVVEHYGRAGDKAGVQIALRKAADSYERMIRSDSTSAGTAALRWNLLRCYSELKDKELTFRVVDEMAMHHPKSILTARALIEGANVAESNGLKRLALGYLSKFLREFPDAPQIPGIRDRIRRLTG